MDKKDKKRLDVLILEKNPQLSRRYIQEQLIAKGNVFVDGKIILKPGKLFDIDSKIDVNLNEPKYVSRAGYKLEKALDHFDLDVTDFVVLDGGVSTGGFSDCLLQRGVNRIYGIDVGYGQLADKLKKDKRLILMEKTNLRDLDKLPESVDLITLDLSFISSLKVVPNLIKFLKMDGKIIILIKPQFESEPEDIKKGGVIKDEKVHNRLIKKVQDGIEELGFLCRGVIESPIRGATSENKEFLAMFDKIK